MFGLLVGEILILASGNLSQLLKMTAYSWFIPRKYHPLGLLLVFPKAKATRASPPDLWAALCGPQPAQVQATRPVQAPRLQQEPMEV